MKCLQAPQNFRVRFIPSAARRGHTQQRAQVHEMRLRALTFVEVKGRAAGAPFGDELLWGHLLNAL